MATLRVCIAARIPGLVSAVTTRCADISGVQFIDVALSPHCGKDAGVCAKLIEADVVATQPFLLPPYLEVISGATSKVKWLHSLWSGVEQLTSLPKPPFLVTRHTGSFGQQMGEFVIGQIIAKERKFRSQWSAQKDRNWLKFVVEGRFHRQLCSLSIGILGVGEIGSKVAEFCKSFGMTVWGLTRSHSQGHCPHIDHSRNMDGLPELLRSCDYVCNILPSTHETRGLLDGEMLAHCRGQNSIFINIGRGDIVKNATIVKAIREGWLAGAVLDVFEEEPLPSDSELWTIPEVVISPHVSGLTPPEEVAETFVSNLRLFMAGKELPNQVDWSRQY